MKRIYNDIPLGSVLFLIGGNQKIKVKNYKTPSDWQWKTENYKIEYEGFAKDMGGYHYNVIQRSKLYGIETLDNGSIQFTICNAFEQF